MAEAISPNFIRAYFHDILNDKLKNHARWQLIENDIAVFCANIPEPVNEDMKTKTIAALEKIKKYLKENLNMSEEELKFLSTEIENISEMRQISLYTEKDDAVDPVDIQKIIKTSGKTEGIIAIPQHYNYEQLKHIVNGVYKATNMVKFIISRETVMYGKITAQLFETSQEIPVAALVAVKKRGDSDEVLHKTVKLFGEIPTGKRENNTVSLREITAQLYTYKFISDQNQEIHLLSVEEVPIGNYVIIGVMTRSDDMKDIFTGNAKLKTKLPHFFAQEIKSQVIRFNDNRAMFDRLRELRVRKSSMFDYPFSFYNKSKKCLLGRQPTWFKWLIWAWLLHSKKGEMNDYPLHLIIIGPPQSGKSVLLSSLHQKSRETREVFTGSGSTIKYLVPSFKEKPASAGYIGECIRFSYLDEFLRCVFNSSTFSNPSDEKNIGLASLNDLLEHQTRDFGSGVSHMKVAMKSRALAVSNPVKGTNSMQKLYEQIDESFLSRWLIYFQHDNSDHVKMIRSSNDVALDEYDPPFENTEWVSFLDYMWTLNAKYDMKRVIEIYELPKLIMSGNVLQHYETRHKHHIECLIDGLVKARCFVTGDEDLTATEEDYARLKEIWFRIINTWVDSPQVKNLPKKERVLYLPEYAQRIYEKLCQFKRPVTSGELRSSVDGEMTSTAFIHGYTILREHELLVEEYDSVRPFWLGEDDVSD